MPDTPFAKAKPHPFRAPGGDAPRTREIVRGGYVELAATSNYSFLTGASHPEELVERAAALGMPAIALTDENTLGGMVRAHVAAKKAGIRLVVGARLKFSQPDEPSVLVYPTDRASYGRLCRLLTLGKRRAPKGECDLSIDDLIEHSEGLLGVVMPPRVVDDGFAHTLSRLRGVFRDDRLSLGAAITYGPSDAARLRSLAALSSHARVPLVAMNDALYHAPERRPLQDVLTCVRLGTTIESAGYALQANAERHLKPPEEMARLFARYPGALARTIDLADRSAPSGGGGGGFSLGELKYEYPDEVCPAGLTPMRHLIGLAWRGAADRYPSGVPEKVRTLVEHEFALIDELGYAPYFLTVHDIVEFARARGILCQGRGAAANSAVCYCLGVTAVDPARVEMLFERFVSRERDEPPDIDIDFEHERREEVIQYLYAKYGRDRAALTAVVTTYRGRSAVRDVGKAMGLSLDCVDRLAKTLDWWDSGTLKNERLIELGLDPRDPTLRRVLALTGQVIGFQRHRSQHVGGFVLSRGPLCELVPIENAAMPERTVIEWDKDDIDALGLLKVDVLGLGMLTAIRKSFDLIGPCGAEREPMTLATIPPEDPAVYEMASHADTVGVFQIESRAQMSMLPRLRPRCYYDLVIEVAIVRPGPIQGNMVHPYLRRRNGEEPVVYPNDAVREVLGRTLGVPLFQEQAMALAIVAGGFTPGEADELRRAMAAWKRKGDAIFRFGRKLVEGMIARGYDADFAARCFEQIKGFSEYGFPESHAASFALLVYASCWLKRYHPAAFCAALINAQPMGFYAPAQLVRDAKEHGVEVRPVDVNASAWDCTLEDEAHGHEGTKAQGGEASRADDPATWGRGGPAVRLGMRLVKSLSERHAHAIAEERAARGPFQSIEEVWRRARVPVPALRALARADAFRSIGLDRQRALWAAGALRDESLPIFESAGTVENLHAAPLPAVPAERQTAFDYNATGLSLKAHPLVFARPALSRRRAVTAAMLRDGARFPQGRRVAVAGVVLVRQRPATASGIMFVTIEDETGSANLIVRPKVYDRFRAALRHSVVLLVAGRVERAGEVVHVQVTRAASLDGKGIPVESRSRDFH